MSKYVIVVESGADVTPELRERYGIVSVPMHVTMGDETVDDGSIDPLEIYSRCNEMGQMPKTSGCSPADFNEVYDRIHAEQPEATILHLAYSEVTTCSHQSSKIAAEGRDYVYSMDTRFVSVGQSLIAVEAAKYIEANPDATVEEIFSFVESVMDRVLLGFVPTDLAFLKVGGRLSNVAFLGAHLLKIKPCIEVTAASSSPPRNSVAPCSSVPVRSSTTWSRRAISIFRILVSRIPWACPRNCAATWRYMPASSVSRTSRGRRLVA